MNRLETIERRLTEVHERLDKKTEQSTINEQLDSIHSTCEATINHIEALSPRQVDPGDAALIIKDTEQLLVTIERAIDADR